MMYTYRVHSVARVIDGDTFDLDLDLGFYTTQRVRVRLADIDTWELYGPNASDWGAMARERAAYWLDNRQLIVQTFKLNSDVPTADGGFGRWAGVIYDADTGESLSDALRDAGMEKQ